MKLKCPHCGKTIAYKTLARAFGGSKSAAKAAASRANGKLGGRPRKDKAAQDKDKDQAAEVAAQ